jgi:TolA-binding protein
MKEKVMKKLTMLVLLGLALGSQALYAGEKGDSTMSFWDMLRSKLESLTPQKKVTATNATGGVRGSAVAAEDVYWKNEATGQTIDSDELDAFKKGVKLIDVGDKGQAKTAFSDFIKKYPGSSLRKDADQALALASKP